MSFLNGSVTTDTSLQPTASTTETTLPDWYTNYATVSYTHLTLPTNREV